MADAAPPRYMAAMNAPADLPLPNPPRIRKPDWIRVKAPTSEGYAETRRLMRSLKLDAADTKQVESWLELPPRADEIDPNDIPREHRAIFLEAAKGMIGALP